MTSLPDATGYSGEDDFEHFEAAIMRQWHRERLADMDAMFRARKEAEHESRERCERFTGEIRLAKR